MLKSIKKNIASTLQIEDLLESHMSIYVLSSFDCTILTPRWLLALLFASINRVFKPFDASGEQAEAPM